MASPSTLDQLLIENQALRDRLWETEETLRGIRSGNVDALFVPGAGSGQVFIREGADQAYRLLIEGMSEGALVITTDLAILYANGRLAELLKTPLDKIIGASLKAWLPADGMRRFENLLRADTPEKRRGEFTLATSDGTAVPMLVSASNLLTYGSTGGYCLVVTDLTAQKRDATERAREKLARQALLSVIEDHKRVEENLRETRARMARVLGTIDQVIWSTDPHTDRVLYINDAVETVYGRPAREFIDTPGLWRELVHPDDAAIAAAMDSRLRTLDSAQAEFRILRPDGTVRWILDRAWLTRDEHGEPMRLDGVVSDITASKLAEAKLLESEERFRTLSEESLVGIYMLEGELVAYANPRTHEIFSQPPGTLIGRPVEEMIVEEDQPRVLDKVRELLSGKAARLSDEFRIRRGDGAIAIVGASGMMTRIGGAPVIIGMVQDITDKVRAEAEIQNYVLRIENMVVGTVDAMSTMVELRDPYTAGHERRVGALAAAIAAELRLDDNVQRGLRIAGAVHDVGKIAVPAEILSKPGRLTSTEYEMVKSHAQQGYEVLRGIDAPWPVAEVARQHHERLDGSGYPRGLKGDEIILEARILAVADVVESMASHRPYRPALGIEKALAEIERGAGTLYDAQAVTACVKLFREQHYNLA